MPYVLGIDIGGTSTTAAISGWEAGAWTPPEVVRLGSRSHAIGSVLHLAADGGLAVGDPVQLDPSRVARDFLRRVGDDVPVLVGGEPCAPQVLAAVLTIWVAERVEAWRGARADQVVLSHPVTWGPYRRSLLRQALADLGLNRVRMIPEPVLAAESHAAGRGEPGGTLAVCSLGAGQCEAAVVRWADGFGFRLLARAGLAEPLGGADVDEALAEYVRSALGRELRQLGTDGRARLVLYGLRRECARAKERLSTATETEVLVPMPRGQVPVPVTRAQLAELARPVLQAGVETLAGTIRAAGLRARDLDAVLLVGGASRMPLVADLVGAAVPGVPLVVEPEPRGLAATGAAVAASRLASKMTTAPRPPQRTGWTAEQSAVDTGSEPAGAEPERRRESPPRPPVAVVAPRLATPRRFGRLGGRS